MANIVCEVHGFSHVSPGTVVISAISANYDNTLMKFKLEGVSRYARIRSRINTALFHGYYAFEMGVECPNGYNKTNNGTFTCEDRRGVLLLSNSIECCQTTGVHEALDVFLDKLVNKDNVCCICTVPNITQLPTLIIGKRCVFRRTYIKAYAGICKWMGKINGIECIGAEMINWISDECDGWCYGIKIFDCRRGHGVIGRSCDFEMEKVEELNLDENGFVDLKNIYFVEKYVEKSKEILKVGRRVEVIYNKYAEDRAGGYKSTFGVVKWTGKINKEICVGIELDYPCEGGMDGRINGCVSFTCESGCGVVCPLDGVILDYYAYSALFTVADDFNIECNVNFKEDWNQRVAKERNFAIDTNIFVHIERSDRIFDANGVLKWLGYISGYSIAILEMSDPSSVTSQESVNAILKNTKPSSHLIVNTQYLFQYRTLKSYERAEYSTLGLDMANTTEFGNFRWRGVDIHDTVFCGFEMESPLKNGTDGIFKGQKLFECKSGCGQLISVEKIRDSILSDDLQASVSKETKDDITSKNNQSNLMSLFITIVTENKISTDEVISSAMNLEDSSILPHIVDNMASSIDLGKHPELINKLLKLGSFETLSMLIEKCPIDDKNDKMFLRVASVFLKNKHYTYFQKCINRCTKKDIFLDNGETFVTQIIKEKVDQRMILSAIEDYKFDLTKPNSINEEPLTLACSNLMMEVMGGIMKYTKGQEARKRICSLCMDREIDTVFNCGHNSCKQCSHNIEYCPICKIDIKSRGKLYFN